jgi:hypothetical protein
MADFIVDPNGNVLNARNKNRHRSGAIHKWLLVAIVTIGLAESGAAWWLYSYEQEVERRETTAATRLADAEQQASTLGHWEHALAERETQLRGRAAGLSDRISQLDRQDQELESNANRLASERDELAGQYFVYEYLLRANERIRESLASRQRLEVATPDGRAGKPAAVLSPEVAVDGAEPTIAAGKNASGHEVFADLESRYETVSQGRSETELEFEARQEAIKELTLACEERALRNSADSYRLEAEVEWQLDVLERIAVGLGLTQAVPRNPLELLGATSLSELEASVLQRIDSLRKRDALTGGLYQLAIEQETRKLEAIQHAKGNPPPDLGSVLGREILALRKGAEVAAILQECEINRDAQIRQREAQKLAHALAIDHANVGARIRLNEIAPEIPAEVLPEIAQRLHQYDVVQQARLRSPGNVVTIGDEVEELVKRRYTDPVKAAELNAILRDRFERTTRRLSVEAFDVEFENWKYGHLTRGQLYELLTLADSALNYAEKIEIQSPAEGVWQSFDRELAEQEREAIANELKERLPGQHGPRVSEYEAGDLTLRDSVTRIPDGNPTDVLSPEIRHKQYLELETFEARTPGHPGIQKKRSELAVAGYQDYVDGLEATAARIAEIEARVERAVTEYRQLGGGSEPPRSMEQARNELARSYKSVELALSRLRIEGLEVQQLQLLQERVKRNLAANPPPPVVEAELPGLSEMQPYSDPGQARRFVSVESQIVDMERAEIELLSNVRQKREEARIAAAELMAEQAEARRLALEMEAQQSFLNELHKSYPTARLVGKLSTGERLYMLGDQLTVGRKNYVDENGVRYELLAGGVL